MDLDRPFVARRLLGVWFGPATSISSTGTPAWSAICLTMSPPAIRRAKTPARTTSPVMSRLEPASGERAESTRISLAPRASLVERLASEGPLGLTW